MRIDELPTPCYVVDEKKLIHNLEILQKVEQCSGAHILLAQKCFSCFAEYPLIAKYISGTTASGLYEARLGFEEMGKPYSKQTHVFAPAYKKEDMAELVQICDHIVFNSKKQLMEYKDICEGKVSVGVRVNPEYSTQEEAHAIYDPCASGSRMGICIDDLDDEIFSEVDGIHFHTLCEQAFEPLQRTWKVVEEKLGSKLSSLKWINMGGGHHITRDDYDVDGLIRLIKMIRKTYDVEVYLEPGEAVALNAGYNVTTVLDIVKNHEIVNLILDTSAACHMPDVLEMPYRPPLKGSGEPGEKKYTYRLSGNTCLSGDIIGDYSFDHEVQIGDRLYFEDMAIYSMVKNNTFNGIPLPAIVRMQPDGNCILIKQFGYEDFKGRLA